ncbi:hypothetical protein BGW38_001397 [Lunasporangiospora selenospora]|uniref:Uncharacterized protein n=1 Tax=Lunasporangiospora selenospora TaxID=979761 RepID=A0A9P6G1Q2_9FUNG|nr:hypothetical protein BGW38_001397 [Lunasporangiospora selenospora]
MPQKTPSTKPLANAATDMSRHKPDIKPTSRNNAPSSSHTPNPVHTQGSSPRSDAVPLSPRARVSSPHASDTITSSKAITGAVPDTMSQPVAALFGATKSAVQSLPTPPLGNVNIDGNNIRQSTMFLLQQQRQQQQQRPLSSKTPISSDITPDINRSQKRGVDGNSNDVTQSVLSLDQQRSDWIANTNTLASAGTATGYSTRAKDIAADALSRSRSGSPMSMSSTMSVAADDGRHTEPASLNASATITDYNTPSHRPVEQPPVPWSKAGSATREFMEVDRNHINPPTLATEPGNQLKVATSAAGIQDDFLVPSRRDSVSSSAVQVPKKSMSLEPSAIAATTMASPLRSVQMDPLATSMLPSSFLRSGTPLPSTTSTMSVFGNQEIVREMSWMREEMVQYRIQMAELKSIIESEYRQRKILEERLTSYATQLSDAKLESMMKDTELRRGEAMMMMVKAQGEIQEVRESVAKARQERAEARERAAVAEAENYRLQKLLQSKELMLGAMTPIKLMSHQDATLEPVSGSNLDQ